ncbi:hypothetical protein P154DRAFT_562094 [Amniculicola lignicola CBS 123094]|uniref:Uncharacterized protein n=1 Tax=Amniculicola lignicola CBS 123094 TaxID=1392246 RepID=A0A6A5WKU9_9PLEO|nr:hypothetical protein P154DRAFT_562094 [Amniculicola lignicola CBS 123094]
MPTSVWLQASTSPRLPQTSFTDRFLGSPYMPTTMIPKYDVGEQCQMIVDFSQNGSMVTTFRYFIVQARQPNVGYWEYQLREEGSIENHEGNRWFSEGVLRDP